MPGRKRAPGSAPPRKRTRTGCRPCRTRKVKCDEAKPRCRNCVSRNLSCSNGIELKWHEEFEIRGLTFGRQGVWSKDPAAVARGASGSPRSPSTPQQQAVLVPASAAEGYYCWFPPIRTHHFLNTSLADLDGSSGARLQIEDDKPAREQPSATLKAPRDKQSPATTSLFFKGQAATLVSRNPSPFPSFDSFTFGLLEYYLLRLCPLTTSSCTSPSPFADLILPVLSEPGYEDVLRSVMALSARHRSAQDPSWSRTAMSLKGAVLGSLQQQLAVVENATPNPQILVIMMFLCLYEIVDRCDYRWVIHLRASQDIIRRRRTSSMSRSCTTPQADNGYGLSAFAERFFAFQDAISRTACGDAPLFDTDYWENHDQYTQVDPWMGCSPELAGVLCSITELGRMRAANKISTNKFYKEAAIIEARISAMESSIRATTDDVLRSAAELKRVSALLYLHCVLYDASPSTALVSQLTNKVLERVQGLLKKGCARGLAFPVFVAGVALGSSDELAVRDVDTGNAIHGRRLVLEALDAMSRESLSNVTRTKAVIQKVWKLRDLHSEVEAGVGKDRESSSDALNDWTSFVGPHSTYICLA
ncbi:fungal-specific transcription factor domain-containing protein [Xylariales sp. PMI_506]|nr:fungal-specific transcription factor domain-containing protein [Xylariales sp. PMI_506]